MQVYTKRQNAAFVGRILSLSGLSMKIQLAILYLLVSLEVQATTYYFSNQNGLDSRSSLQAQNASTPWKTVDKLNMFFSKMLPGDSILFERGNDFPGAIVVTASGSYESPIVLSSFGLGRNPVISGFTTIDKWISEGGGIYSYSMKVPQLNLVSFDGKSMPMGRFPNTGYLRYQHHDGNISITDEQLASTSSWEGAEIVIRKSRWILDRHTITNQTGGQLFYNSLNTYGNNSSYSPVDGNGYFIQGHINTLDQLGEWYYNTVTGKLFMYFGAYNPSSHLVKASSLTSNISISNYSFINLKSIDFEGGNINGANLISCHDVTFENCNFYLQGGNGVYGGNINNIKFLGGSIVDAQNNGMFFEYQATNCLINGVSTTKVGVNPGGLRSGDGSGNGIFIIGDENTIQNCRISNVGYNGINFVGNNIDVYKNYVDSFCAVKDDGGGIYTYAGNNGTYTNRKIRSNIILNGLTNSFEGTKGDTYAQYSKSVGIYVDDYSQNVDIVGNTVANCAWAGIFIHNSLNIKILGNLLFNNGIQLYFEQSSSIIRNITRNGNTLVSKQLSQPVFYNNSYVNESAGLTGSSDNNIYSRPLNDANTFKLCIDGVVNDSISLSYWKSRYSTDINSSTSPITYSAKSFNEDDIRFEYNATDLDKVISLTGDYLGIDKVQYSQSVILHPFTSIILFRQLSLKTLPISYLNFNGFTKENMISLLWESGGKDETSLFNIERSADGVHFMKIGTIGVADKTAKNHYSFTDHLPLPGKNYYRLKSSSTDGKISNSKIIQILCNEADYLHLGPNPARDFFKISIINGNKDIRGILTIQTISGQCLRNINCQFLNGYCRIDIAALKAGIYTANIAFDNQVIIKQFLKL